MTANRSARLNRALLLLAGVVLLAAGALVPVRVVLGARGVSSWVVSRSARMLGFDGVQ
jgi:hypothetical protein